MTWRQGFTRHLRQLRIVYDPVSPQSLGLKTFIETNYIDLKTLNPKFTFLIRDNPGSPATITAYYDLDASEQVSVDDLSPNEVEKALKGLVKLGMRQPKSPHFERPFFNDITSHLPPAL
eukprot:TRINITY_DN12572_c0_g1_i1.p2 TRINITY_DN12572_c0_g1~~TRINITY_DN12572_c0_g1_i1.p2  ORF type:complete len:119 (-),score=16.28 TRINITY_DN12572_c0_g1_i1:269-625(-)